MIFRLFSKNFFGQIQMSNFLNSEELKEIVCIAFVINSNAYLSVLRFLNCKYIEQMLTVCVFVFLQVSCLVILKLSQNANKTRSPGK